MNPLHVHGVFSIIIVENPPSIYDKTKQFSSVTNTIFQTSNMMNKPTEETTEN